MFERYTEKARRVIFFARYEASQFRSPYIETEHVLLGAIREIKHPLIAMLGRPEALEPLRSDLERMMGPRKPGVSTSVDLPVSNEVKRVLAYAAEEAERLEMKHIGGEHLVLALLREEQSVAAEVLRRNGLDLEKARASVMESAASQQPSKGAAEGVYVGPQVRITFLDAAGACLAVASSEPQVPRVGDRVVLTTAGEVAIYNVEDVRFVYGAGIQVGDKELHTLGQIYIRVSRGSAASSGEATH